MGGALIAGSAPVAVSCRYDWFLPLNLPLPLIAGADTAAVPEFCRFPWHWLLSLILVLGICCISHKEISGEPRCLLGYRKIYGRNNNESLCLRASASDEPGGS